jgi:sugar lactone lactonase YvrE
VRVDDARGRLWLTDGKTVFVYALDSRALLAKIDRQSLGAVADSFLNDIAIDADGNAYVTDSRDSSLVRVSGADFHAALLPLRGIPFGNQNNVRYNLNGVVLDRDGKSLIAVKTNDGTLWRIPLAGGDAREIRLEKPVTHGDGLAWAPDGRLWVFRNFEDKVSAIDRAEGTGIRPVEDQVISGLSTPTAGVFLPDGRLAIVNSQFAREKPELPFGLLVTVVGK